MSARRGFALAFALGLAGVCATAAPLRAAATDSILVTVGGDLAGRAGNYLDIPVSVDMRAAPGRMLGGYRLTLVYDPAVLAFNNWMGGGFADPLVNTDSAGQGRVRFTAILPAGATGAVTLFTARFYVYSDTAPSAVTLTLEDLTAAATSVTPFEDLLPLARVVNGTFCRALGLWGDPDHDGTSNARDALIALSSVVGLVPPDTAITPSLADVDGDGAVTSRDALVILSYAVGLPVTGFRVLLPAAGACGTAATTLVVLPDTLELVEGQYARVSVEARDRLGRTVPATAITWRTSDGLVAAYDDDDGEILGRSAGTAILTAELGPGVSGRLVVIVTARRFNWYVDVRRARNVVTQTGAPRAPMEFIGDAVDVAQRGDTVRVAGGTYEEVISDGRSLVILGDPLDRPVIDPRGAPYAYATAVSLGDNSGVMVLANLVVRYGNVELYDGGSVVRNVRFEDTQNYRALYIEGNYDYDDAPPAVAGSSSYGLPRRALVDSVVMVRHRERGIEVRNVDTVTVRNSVVAGDSVYESCYAGGGNNGGIVVDNSAVVEVRDNVVSGSRCQGISIYADTGRVTVSRNRVASTGSHGIVASARIVGFDHNSVRDAGVYGGCYYCSYQNSGIAVTYYYNADSVTSRGDTVVNVQGDEPRGLRIDTASVAVIDSLVVDSVGVSGSSDAIGVYVDRIGRLDLSHSRILNSAGQGVSICAPRSVLHSRGNRISTLGGDGISLADCSESGAPDSLISVHDTLFAAGIGIYADDLVYVRVDSADLTGQELQYRGGVHVNGAGRLIVRDSKIRRFADGVASYNGSTTAEILRNTFFADSTAVFLSGTIDSVVIAGNTADSSRLQGLFVEGAGWARVDSNVVTASGVHGIIVSGAAGAVRNNNVAVTGQHGITLVGASDTVVVAGNAIDGAGADGIAVEAGARVRADSNKVTNSAQSGLIFYSASGLVTRNRLENNGWYGVAMDASNPVGSTARNNVIQGNGLGGALNHSFAAATLDAASNFWGDPLGPRCDSTVTGAPCNPASLGDEVVTAGITFLPFLTSPDAGVPAAPSMQLRPAARRPAPAVLAPLVRESRPAQAPAIRSPRRQPPATARPAAAQVPSARPTRPPSWRKGRESVNRESPTGNR